MEKRKYLLADEIEYDSIEKLVSMGVQCGLVPKEEREDIAIFIESIYKSDTFYEPTEVVANRADGFRVPLTLKALKGLLHEREWIIAKRKDQDYKQQCSQSIPKELQTDKGKEILKKALNNGLLTFDPDGNNLWNETASLYGYFIDRVSDKMDMRPSNNRICWEKFAFIKNHDRLLSTARSKVTRYTNNREQVPEGDDRVNDLFFNT